MENLLYYPYINVPETAWTARTLLYYDRVGSIVPQRYFYEPDNYNPFMREMVRNELIEPINPIEVLDHPLEISRPFIKYLNDDDFDLQKRRKAFLNGSLGRIHRDKFTLNNPRIHVDKFDGEIFYQLKQAGLAIRQDDEWFIVEKKTANELMTFLASVLGGKLKYQPTTDKIQKRFKAVFKSKQDFKISKKASEKRELILNELIPFPEQIDIVKLRAFKDKNLDLLKAFKNKVELIVLNPNMEEGSALFHEVVQELKIRKAELSAKMNESKLGGVLFGTICGITAAVIGLPIAETAETATTVDTVVGGLAGFANAVYSALQIERAEDIFDQSGMKYLALVDKRLRKPNTNKDFTFVELDG
ncbi:hypothetical protein OCK74_11925 [Chitinophagaceae bacterium LB-8]|uniref:Kinase n=1 Tax=Paraflavisolibacter caeni TaxID=2982496 RepID=A0A9X2XV22_9BACT|nr:hypothetical protein [Paraflavisolibacter caeni]MCU7549829.1 hypothetical protein [Paraflavisolibacter caeni]